MPGTPEARAARGFRLVRGEAVEESVSLRHVVRKFSGSGIFGASLPPACGAARAAKKRAKDRLASMLLPGPQQVLVVCMRGSNADT